MTLTLELSRDLECRLARDAAALGIPVETYAIEVLKQGCRESRSPSDLAAALEAWVEDFSPVAPADDLPLKIDADRLSHRTLYPPELKGVTW